MSLQNLKAYHGAKQKVKRVGRGQGSGKGTYSARGGKGQTARSGGGRRPGFEGGQTPLSRRIPKYRGFKNPNQVKFQAVNLHTLDKNFSEGETVTRKELLAKGLIQKDAPVKILGEGKLTKKLTIEAEKFSASALEKMKEVKAVAKELATKKAEEKK